MKQRTRLMHNGDDLINLSMHKKMDGDDNEVQLHRMKPQEHFIEAQVQEGDTLQAIALRFYCTISELKRVNHIHKDNEIFARRTIKVPVTPYSVLTERIPSEAATEAAPSTCGISPSLQGLIDNCHTNGDSAEVPSNTEMKEANDFSIDCNAVVMNSTLAPSVVPFTDVEELEDPLSEDTQLLPKKPKVSVEAVVVKELTSHGADFGLKWFHLVGCMLVLGVVIPLIYIFFYLDKHEQEFDDKPPLQGNR